MDVVKEIYDIEFYLSEMGENFYFQNPHDVPEQLPNTSGSPSIKYVGDYLQFNPGIGGSIFLNGIDVLTKLQNLVQLSKYEPVSPFITTPESPYDNQSFGDVNFDIRNGVVLFQDIDVVGQINHVKEQMTLNYVLLYPELRDLCPALCQTNCTPQCVEGEMDCNICHPFVVEACIECTNCTYLHEGDCVQECPHHLVAVGEDCNGRTCQTRSPTTSQPTLSPTCPLVQPFDVEVGLQLLVDQSGSISEGHLNTSINVIEDTVIAMDSISLLQNVIVDFRTFDVTSYEIIRATQNATMFYDLNSKILREPDQGTAVARAISQTSRSAISSLLQLQQARILIIVTDGETLEECGDISKVGPENNCVEAAMQAFINANWTVLVLAVVDEYTTSRRRQYLEHLQRLTNPRDEGYWDSTVNAWICPTGVCGNEDVSPTFDLGAVQTLFILPSNSAGAINLLVILYAIQIAIQHHDLRECTDRKSVV